MLSCGDTCDVVVACSSRIVPINARSDRLGLTDSKDVLVSAIAPFIHFEPPEWTLSTAVAVSHVVPFSFRAARSIPREALRGTLALR